MYFLVCSLSKSSFLPGDELSWKAYKKDKMKINFKITGMCPTKVALSWTSFAVSLLLGKLRTFTKYSQNHFGEELHFKILFHRSEIQEFLDFLNQSNFAICANLIASNIYTYINIYAYTFTHTYTHIYIYIYCSVCENFQ